MTLKATSIVRSRNASCRSKTGRKWKIPRTPGGDGEKALISLVRGRFKVKIKVGPDLEVKGNILDHEYKIGEGHPQVVEVSKKGFRSRDSYGVEIEPVQEDIVIVAAGLVLFTGAT